MKTITLAATAAVTTVDDQDYEMLKSLPWRLMGWPQNIQVGAKIKVAGQTTFVYMARLITGAGPNEIVKHRDGNNLINTRANLLVKPKKQK